MIVRIDPALPGSPAEQLITQVVAGIESGDLPPGAPLPTIRSLAGDLGVSPGTVARAYAELESDGWVVTQGRRGTAVAARRPRGSREEVSSAARALARAVLVAGLRPLDAHRALDVAFAQDARSA